MLDDQTIRKMRTDSTWNGLSEEQTELLDDWLFGQRLSYEETLGRVKERFGLEASITSLARYYQRRARLRQAAELVVAGWAADELNMMPGSADGLRTAAVKLAGKAVLKAAAEEPEQVEKLALLTRILLESERNELRRERLRLSERMFQFEATAACEPELPLIRARLKSIGDDPSLKEEEKLVRIHQVMFGRAPAKDLLEN